MYHQSNHRNMIVVYSAVDSKFLLKQPRRLWNTKWTASSEFGTYRPCEQRRFRRACASAQSCQNLRCSLIQAVSQEEPSGRKPDARRLACKRHRVRSPRPAHSFVETWSGKHFYGHSPSAADSRRAVVSYWRKNVHKVLVNCLGGLPRNSVARLTDRAWNDLKCVEGP